MPKAKLGNSEKRVNDERPLNAGNMHVGCFYIGFRSVALQWLVIVKISTQSDS